MFVVHIHGDHKVHEARVTETLTLILGGLHSDASFGCTAQVIDPGMRPTRNDRAKGGLYWAIVAGACSEWTVVEGHRTARFEGRKGGVLYMYVFCLSQRQVKEQETRVSR